VGAGGGAAMSTTGGLPERIGHYRIVSELGRGGMGVVYKAHEESLNRHVALKVLGEHLVADDDAVERFVREARSAARLNHPNIVQIYAISEDAGRHFFVMEYVTGRSLQQILRADGRLDPDRAARLVLQAAAGLEAAHEHGIVHRDIKPANLMVDARGLVKIADFGLALAAGGAMSRLTATGMFMGTPGYLSPEQCLDEDIDQRTDIYSLGVTFFEALTGRMPFTADSPIALINKIIRVEPPELSELAPEVSEPIRATVARMMAKDRSERFQDCRELIAALRAAVGATGAVDDPASLAAASLAPGRPTGTEAVRIETQPTQHVPSGAAVGSAVPPPPPPPPPADAVAPPPPAAETAYEVQPAPDTAAAPRRRSPWLLAAIAVSVVVAGVAVAAVVALRSGLLGAGPPDASGTAEGPPAVAAVLPTPTPDEPPSSGSDAVEPDGSPPGGPVDEPEPTPGPDASAGAAEAAHATPVPVATAAGGPPRRAPAATPPPVEPDRERGQTPADPLPTKAPAAADDGTIVVAVGDPLLADAAEALVERALERAGEPVVDERGIPGFVPPAGEPVDREQALRLRVHARHLILLRAETLGQRELRFLGRAELATRAHLSVVVIDLSEERRIGHPTGVELEYTRLNLDRVLAKELRPRMPRLVETVR